MTGRSPESLSRIPGFDPRQVPIEPVAESGTPVLAERLTPDALRRRFAAPPVWQPEFQGDSFKARDGEPRAAAVLVPIVTHAAGPTVLLTERTAHLSSHAGQVAFPGGRVDPDDASVVHAALREAWEEVGLAPSRVDVIGHLPDYLTGTGYRVTPVVGLVTPGFELALQAQEVAEAFEVPLAFLMDPRHHRLHRMRIEQGERMYYSMPWRAEGAPRDFFIWGATAAMLRNLYRFLGA